MKLTHLLVTVCALLCAAATCNPTPLPVPPPAEDAGPPEPVPVEDAGVDAEPDPRLAACLAADERLCTLGCKTPTGLSLCTGPTGVRFAARCMAEKESTWDVECLGTITDCSQVNAAATGALCADGGAP